MRRYEAPVRDRAAWMVSAVEQRLAAQPLGDADGFADRGLGGLVFAYA